MPSHILQILFVKISLLSCHFIFEIFSAPTVTDLIIPSKALPLLLQSISIETCDYIYNETASSKLSPELLRVETMYDLRTAGWERGKSQTQPGLNPMSTLANWDCRKVIDSAVA